MVPLMRAERHRGDLRFTYRAVCFSDKQVALLRNFADQAVIAIENARSQRDEEALERQTATGGDSRHHQRSPTDVQPVLDAIAESAMRLCEASDVIIRRVDGSGLRAVAHVGPVPVSVDVYPISRHSVGGRVVIDRRMIHVQDILSTGLAERISETRHSGTERCLAVPLVREGVVTGVIFIRRPEVRPLH